MQTPLLSIVIPTKDRFSYLVGCLKSLANIDREKAEVIVHDNSDSSRLNELLHVVQNHEFSYFHATEKLSGVGNFDAAIAKATGKYVMVIGDDDSCSAELIRLVEQIDDEGCDALLTPKAIYFWPDISFKYFSKKFSGQLFINSFTGNERMIDAEEERISSLRSGACEILNLPRVYHGVVKREVLEKVRVVAKAYSPGPSPDIANAIAVSHIVRKFKYVDIPVVITGNAAKSGAGMGAAGKHIGKIGAISFLPENAEESWSDLVPRFWSGQTVWAQSVILAMKAFGNEEPMHAINLPLLHAKTYVFNPGYRQEVMRNYWAICTRMKKDKGTWLAQFACSWIHAQASRLRPIITKIPYLAGSNKSLKQMRFTGLPTVHEASIELEKVIKTFKKQ